MTLVQYNWKSFKIFKEMPVYCVSRFAFLRVCGLLRGSTEISPSSTPGWWGIIWLKLHAGKIFHLNWHGRHGHGLELGEGFGLDRERGEKGRYWYFLNTLLSHPNRKNIEINIRAHGSAIILPGILGRYEIWICVCVYYKINHRISGTLLESCTCWFIVKG